MLIVGYINKCNFSFLIMMTFTNFLYKPKETKRNIQKSNRSTENLEVFIKENKKCSYGVVMPHFNFDR